MTDPDPTPLSIACARSRGTRTHVRCSALAICVLTAAACSVAPGSPGAGPRARARNVILFLADAGGLATLSAASLLGHGSPQKLFVQSWPHVGLVDTSAASEWVTDSAAGMTAIVTGHKTHNGVVSQGTDAVYGKKDGTPLKTLLEHAEERGLLTGVVSDTTIADATPAACYAHANDRDKYGEIFLQIFAPRFGDGVDVVLGPGRSEVYGPAVRALGQDLDTVARGHGRPVYASLDEMAPDAQRGLVVTQGPIDLAHAARVALRALSRSPKGYFLMIESDVHTDDPEAGLRRLVAFDALIREIAGIASLPTHSCSSPRTTLSTSGSSQAVPSGRCSRAPREAKGALGRSPAGGSLRLPFIRVDNDHTGEEVVAAARGPGAERVRGFLPNVALFQNRDGSLRLDGGHSGAAIATTAGVPSRAYSALSAFVAVSACCCSAAAPISPPMPPNDVRRGRLASYRRGSLRPEHRGDPGAAEDKRPPWPPVTVRVRIATPRAAGEKRTVTTWVWLAARGVDRSTHDRVGSGGGRGTGQGPPARVLYGQAQLPDRSQAQGAEGQAGCVDREHRGHRIPSPLSTSRLPPRTREGEAGPRHPGWWVRNAASRPGSDWRPESRRRFPPR